MKGPMNRQRSRRIAWGSAGKVPGQFCSNSQGLTTDGKWGILAGQSRRSFKKLLKRHCERGKDVQFLLFCIEWLYSGSIIVINQSRSKRKWKGIPRQSSGWNSALVTAEGAGLIPWWGTKILQVAQQGQKLGEDDKDKSLEINLPFFLSCQECRVPTTGLPGKSLPFLPRYPFCSMKSKEKDLGKRQQ